MTYNLLLVGHAQPETIAAALAQRLRVPTGEVDVADADGDPDARNWDALVSCEYAAVPGDVSMVLDVYAQDSVANQPVESELAAGVASDTRTVVLYSPEESAISAHWLVTPEGLVTRARLVVSDDEEPVYAVEAVEAAVEQLPRARVMHLPEVVREQKISTPVADAFTSAFKSLHETDGCVDTSPADEVADAVRDARSDLAAWEKLIRRMETGWAPSGWYPLEFYREVLEYRDEIGATPYSLPPSLADLHDESLAQLDQRFMELTVEDKERAVTGNANASESSAPLRSWWWYRRPDPLPWLG
jgi:hypothetical protein